jgi:hypothetical protein
MLNNNNYPQNKNNPSYLMVFKPPKDLNVRGAGMLAIVEKKESKEEKDKEIKRVAKDISIRHSLTEENIKKVKNEKHK